MNDALLTVCAYAAGIIAGIVMYATMSTHTVTPEQWQYAESVCKVNGGIHHVLQNADTVYC